MVGCTRLPSPHHQRRPPDGQFLVQPLMQGLGLSQRRGVGDQCAEFTARHQFQGVHHFLPRGVAAAHEFDFVAQQSGRIETNVVLNSLSRAGLAVPVDASAIEGAAETAKKSGVTIHASLDTTVKPREALPPFARPKAVPRASRRRRVNPQQLDLFEVCPAQGRYHRKPNSRSLLKILS